MISCSRSPRITYLRYVSVATRQEPAHLILRQDLDETVSVDPALVVLGGHGVVRHTDTLGSIFDAEADVCSAIRGVNPQRACDAAQDAGIHVQAACHLARRHIAHLKSHHKTSFNLSTVAA